MKYLFLISVVLFSCMHSSYGQTKLSNLDSMKEYIIVFDSTGFATLKKDSTHYWFEKYLKLKNKHVPDSINPYYKLLMRKK